VTIRDIAEMARVSKGTVSRVLNGKPGVGEETRGRVLKLIESLDFHPNAAARGLAARRSNTIGFVIPHTGRHSLAGSFWPVLLTEIAEQAAARGMTVLLSTSRSEQEAESAFKAVLRGRRIDGAIVGAEQAGERSLAELVMRDIPFVVVGRQSEAVPWWVDVDNAAGARMAVEHLVGLGHRAIVMVAGPGHLHHVQERVRGFQLAMKAAGLDGSRVVHCPYETEAVLPAVSAAVATGRGVTAVFAAAGDLVLGSILACRQAGRPVPQATSLVAFDDHPLFAQFPSGITAVSQPLEQMGREALDMLFHLIEGREPERREVVLAPRLVARGSSALASEQAG